ncbi:hypothetical protein REPUB_Repub14bG0071000 [Reevesia pubescens]
MFFCPPLVMSLYITGHLNTIFSAEHRKEILRYIYCHQILGVYEWSGCHPMPLEFWLFPSYFPVHPGCKILSLEDLHDPHTLPQILLWDSLYMFSEPLFNCWPFTKLREKALKVTMDLIPYEDESSRYITIGCVEKVAEYVWVGEDGIKMQSFGSQVWDASFLIQALLASNLSHEIGPALMKGHNFLEIMDGKSLIVLQKCCLYFAMMPPELVGEKMEPQQFYDSVNVILFLSLQALVLFKKLYRGHRQNEIENFIRKAAQFLEDIQYSDGSWYGNWGICFFYGTWFALQGLMIAGKTYKNCVAICKGVKFLLKTQREDGDWGESYLSCPRKVNKYRIK